MSVFFGEPWPSGICEDATQVPTPVGKPCLSCGELVVEGDQGSFMPHVSKDGMEIMPHHKECMLRDVLGGIGHLEDHGHWCGPEGDPDGGRTRRQSALEVWEWVQRHGVDAAAAR